MERFITARIAAKLLAVSPESVRRYCRTGQLRHRRTLGGGIRVSRDAVEAFLARNTTGRDYAEDN